MAPASLYRLTFFWISGPSMLKVAVPAACKWSRFTDLHSVGASQIEKSRFIAHFSLLGVTISNNCASTNSQQLCHS